MCLTQSFQHLLFVRQVLEKIAHKYNIHAAFGKGPDCHATLIENFHIGIREPFDILVQIDRNFILALDVVDELAVTRTNVDDCILRHNELAEKSAAYHSPYLILCR